MGTRTPNSSGSPPGSERGTPTLGLGIGGSSYAQVPSSPTSPYTPPLPNNGAESPGRRTSPPDWAQPPPMSTSNQSSMSSRQNSRFVSSPLNPHAVGVGHPPQGGSRTRPSSWGSSRQPSDVSDMTDHDLTRGIMTHSVGGQYGPYTVRLQSLIGTWVMTSPRLLHVFSHSISGSLTHRGF